MSQIPDARSQPVIVVDRVGKVFRSYARPVDRLLDGVSRGRSRARSFTALADVTFAVHRGETFGIVGTNGSGKSTLLQILSGILQASSGTVKVPPRVAALLELGAGFHPEYSGRENALLNASLLGLGAREAAARLDAIVAFAELEGFIDQPVKTYSSGMFVRLAFSVAVHVQPDVLIVDEALSVGDARFQARCMARLREMQRTGTTLLFVSHDIGAVRALCDRVLWLDEGRVRMIGAAMPVTARYMEALFADAAPAPLEGTPASATTRPPVARWGSRVGSILEADVLGGDGSPRDVFHDGEDLCVRIRYRVPRDAAPGVASPAFSIKDLQGSDLITTSSWDDRVRAPAGADVFDAHYRFPAALAPGDYFLVAALEDRSADGPPAYFDYIEGARFFATASSRRVHGRFLPAIRQRIVPLEAAACA